jgi:hypothetical protein
MVVSVTGEWLAGMFGWVWEEELAEGWAMQIKRWESRGEEENWGMRKWGE